LKIRSKQKVQIYCSLCGKGIKNLTVNENSEVTEESINTGCNHASCMCPCMSSENVEDKCFDQLVNYKGNIIFKLI
jgi:hypothetical protein